MKGSESKYLFDLETQGGEGLQIKIPCFGTSWGSSREVPLKYVLGWGHTRLQMTILCILKTFLLEPRAVPSQNILCVGASSL